MRVSSLGVARPLYYDRNAVGIGSEYSGTVAPHASTIRVTFTIATGKKEIIENIFGYMRRITAATSPLDNAMSVYSNSGSFTNTYDDIYMTAAVVNQTSKGGTTSAITLIAGDIITAVTADASTGGTIFFRWSIKGTTYDA